MVCPITWATIKSSRPRTEPCGTPNTRCMMTRVPPISPKFGMATLFDPLEAANCWKFGILKIQNGGDRHLGTPRHLGKSKNCDILTAVWPISTQFGTVTQFGRTVLQTVAQKVFDPLYVVKFQLARTTGHLLPTQTRVARISGNQCSMFMHWRAKAISSIWAPLSWLSCVADADIIF